MPRIAFVALVALLILLSAMVRGAAASLELRPAASTPAAKYSPDDVIVQWTREADRGDRTEARVEADVTFVSDLGNRRFQLVETEPGQAPGEAVAELEANPAVVLAERDSYAAPASIPDDPLFGQQWGLENLGVGVGGFSGAIAGADVDAFGAWNRTVGTPSTVVAVIDSGYRFDSPDLGPVAWSNPGEDPGNGIDDDGNGYVDDDHGYDFVGTSSQSPSQDNDPTDDDLIAGGHGVHTAGTIGAAGDDGVGITGVAQDIRMVPLRVCANWPSLSESRCPSSSIVAAINYAGANGARVANISLTSMVESGAQLNALAENPQTLFVIAAGNDGQSNDSVGHYPCDFEPASTGIAGAIDNVVCVAATDQADELAGFSDWSPTTVDLGAPGTEILSTYPEIDELFAESFELDDFSTNWTATGANGGFGRTDEAPLTSFGISDSPGAAPDASSGRSSTLTNPVAVPADYGACRLSGREFAALDGGSFSLIVFKDGLPAYTFQLPSTAGSQMIGFRTTPMTDLADSDVHIRVRYLAGTSPTAASGVWVDDLVLRCYAPASEAPGYAFLEGTSMAAPHVSGTAALLFSLKPAATIAEVRSALLASVDANPSLEGMTVSGGRLDAAAAIAYLQPPAPLLTSTDPTSPAGENEPRILGSAEAGTSVDVYSGPTCEGPAIASGSAAELASPGIGVEVVENSSNQFSATAVNAALNPSACSEPISYVEVSPDETAPGAPVLATDPPSPAANSNPRIIGSADAGSSVAIYLGPACDGAPLSVASADALASPGIPVHVPQESSRTYSADAMDEATNTSPCSAPISYTNTSMIGASSVIVIWPPSPADPPAPRSGCVVPKLAGKTLGQAKAALAGAGCRVGKVGKPRERKGRKAPALVVKSSAPRAGATASSGVVSLTLGPKPKKPHH